MRHFQSIITELRVSVSNDFAEKLQGALPLFSLGGSKIILPPLRHLVEEPGMLNRSWLFAEGGHILRPVVDLIIGLVASGKASNRSVVVVKRYMVIEDFGLYFSPASMGDSPYLFVSIVAKPVLLTVSVV